MNRDEYHELRRQRHHLRKEIRFHRGFSPGASLSTASMLAAALRDVEAAINRSGPGNEPWRLMREQWSSRRLMAAERTIERKQREYWSALGRHLRASRDATSVAAAANN